MSSMSPVPRVSVKVSGHPVGAVSLTIWRESSVGLKRVRSSVEASATDPYSVVDYAAPFNEDITYWADYYDTARGYVASSERATTRVVFDGTVLHQPLDPSRAVLVRDLSRSAQVLSARAYGEHVRPGGASLPTWIGQGGSDLATRLNLGLMSDRDRAQAASMFGTRAAQLPPIICLRSSLPLHLPQPFIFLVEDAPWASVDHFAGGEMTELEWDVVETSEPALNLLVSPLSYEDFEAHYATYEALEADPLNVTYEALEERTDLAGVA